LYMWRILPTNYIYFKYFRQAEMEWMMLVWIERSRFTVKRYVLGCSQQYIGARLKLLELLKNKVERARKAP
jgi:hypothetical protein